jgi:hypothetical protein
VTFVCRKVTKKQDSNKPRMLVTLSHQAWLWCPIFVMQAFYTYLGRVIHAPNLLEMKAKQVLHHIHHFSCCGYYSLCSLYCLQLSLCSHWNDVPSSFQLMRPKSQQ